MLKQVQHDGDGEKLRFHPSPRTRSGVVLLFSGVGGSTIPGRARDDEMGMGGRTCDRTSFLPAISFAKDAARRVEMAMGRGGASACVTRLASRIVVVKERFRRKCGR